MAAILQMIFIHAFYRFFSAGWIYWLAFPRINYVKTNIGSAVAWLRTGDEPIFKPMKVKFWDTANRNAAMSRSAFSPTFVPVYFMRLLTLKIYCPCPLLSWWGFTTSFTVTSYELWRLKPHQTLLFVQKLVQNNNKIHHYPSSMSLCTENPSAIDGLFSQKTANAESAIMSWRLMCKNLIYLKYHEILRSGVVSVIETAPLGIYSHNRVV